MTFSSFIIVIFLALIGAISGVLYIRKTHKNTLQKRETRKQLLERAKFLPLPKMLQALGIGLGNYFYKVPLDEIDQCITHCETCSTIDQCHEKLKIPELNPGDIEFCSNKEHLSQFSRENRIRA